MPDITGKIDVALALFLFIIFYFFQKILKIEQMRFMRKKKPEKNYSSYIKEKKTQEWTGNKMNG